MWLGFGTLFGFTFTCEESMPPAAFQHSCHLFYQQRCIDLPDDKEKWTGHRLKSKKWAPGSNENEMLYAREHGSKGQAKYRMTIES
jgi:hypothetical protein